MTMNIYKVSRTDHVDWDQYDAFVCIAETAVDAMNMHPDDDDVWDIPDTYDDGFRRNTGWVKRKELDMLQVEYVGTASDGPARIILASFNAG